MKKLFMAIMACMYMTGVNAQEAETTKQNSLANSDLTNVYLDSNRKVSMGPGALAVGWNFGINMPNDIDKANGHSIFVAWDLFNLNFNLGSKHNQMSVGFGMIWNKYASSNKDCFLLNKDINQVVIGSGKNLNLYSRYLTYSLSIPVLYSHHMDNGLSISAGPVLNFNVHSSIYNEVNDHKEGDLCAKSVYHNPVTVDLRLMLTYHHFGFMFKYSPMRVIESGKGPDFKSFGMGLLVDM